ncbi:hypothetical protein [Paenibacillus koleovorans]|uniref:hypothetical protein n=1 Tax=Paenibacillus koleovorans TaxID=121608 RepID=UPI000FD6FCF6|nr:hypothetical protein [Paenibacillus koleovorans]
MYTNGQVITDDRHFQDHIEHGVPIQIYLSAFHKDIGIVERYTAKFIKVNNIYYSRDYFTFVSRPGY